MIQPSFYTWLCTNCGMSGLSEVLPGRESERAAMFALERRHRVLSPDCLGELSVIDPDQAERRACA